MLGANVAELHTQPHSVQRSLGAGAGAPSEHVLGPQSQGLSLVEWTPLLTNLLGFNPKHHKSSSKVTKDSCHLLKKRGSKGLRLEVS